MEQSAYRNRNSQDLRKKVVGQIRRRGPHTRATLTAGTEISITTASGTATNSAGTGPVSVASNSVTIANQYSPNSVFCDNGPTEIVDVVNPVTVGCQKRLIQLQLKIRNIEIQIFKIILNNKHFLNARSRFPDCVRQGFLARLPFF